MVASTEPCEGFVGSIHAASSSSDDPRPCLYASSPASARPADHPSRIEPSSPVHSADTAPRRVAYIWSSSLERLSSALPSNPDRSMHVHSLIRVMDMLDLGDPSPDFQMEGGSVGHDTHAASWDAPLVPRSSSDRGSKARVVMPDLQLGQRGWLERYHSPRYIDHIFSLGDGGPDGQGSTSSSGSDTGSTSSSDGSDDHPRKRRRINASKSSKYGLQHDCPPFPSLPDYMTHIAAATSTACRLVACGAYSIAINWDGGRHHAHRSKASGFCYIADVQLGIMLLLKEGKPREKQQAAIHESASAGDCRQDVDGAVAASTEMSARADVESGRDGSGSSTEVVGVKDMPEERTAMKGSAEPPRKPSRKPRVMYLDLDLHYGDGVASAFHSPAVYPYIQDPHQERCTTHDTAHDADTIDLPTTSGSVPLVGPTPKSSQSHTKPPRQPKPSKMPKAPNTLTLSLHHSSPLFFPPPSPLSLLPAPSTPHPFSLSIPLRAYPSGKTYAALWPSIERVKEAYDPDYVVLQLGVDGFQGDPVGKYGNWSTHGEGGALWVVERVKEWGRGLVVLGGGGYGDGRGAARAWAGATGVLLGRDMSSDIDIPHHDHFTSYAPNYTIEVPPGNAKDENTPEYIAEVSATYEIIARRIADIVRGPPT